MNNLVEVFNSRCKTDADKTAFLVKKNGKWDPISWSFVDDRVEKIAAGILSLGLSPGDKISILGNTRLEWTLSDLGVLRAGCVSVGIYQTLSGEQIAYILKDSCSKILFVENAEQIQKLTPHLSGLPDLQWLIIWEDHPKESKIINFSDFITQGTETLLSKPTIVKDAEGQIQSSDIAIIIYTSGTTGPPKGACLTHTNILAEIKATEKLIRKEDIGDIMMFFLPLSHVGERIAGQFMRIKRGVAAAYVEDMNRILEDIVEIQPTFFGSVPRIFEKAYARIQSEVNNASPLKQKIFSWAEQVGREVSRKKQAGIKPLPWLAIRYAVADRLVFKNIRNIFGGEVRYFISSAAPIAVEILEFFHACNMLVLEGYGQTEVSCFCSLCTPDNYRFGSVGKALPGVDLKIAEDGEIMVKGDIVFKGYHNQPELTKKTLTDDGWIFTGDLGRLDNDGYLWITGRKKEIIVTSGGKNVTPSNIENMLMNHPLIELALVHGDRRKYLTALISLSTDSLTAWANAHGYGNSEYEELVNNDTLKTEIALAVEEVNNRLAKFETIKRFAILPNPLLVETGELTPTMKIRRSVIEKKYKDLLDSLYDSE